MKKRSLALMLVLVFTAMAFAHEGGVHLKGKVTAINTESITIETQAKQTKIVVFDESTKFQKSGKPASIKDLKVGDRVVIDIHEMNGKIHGTLVRFGATKTKGAAENHAHTDKH